MQSDLPAVLQVKTSGIELRSTYICCKGKSFRIVHDTVHLYHLYFNARYMQDPI